MSAKKSALGKGLGALLESESSIDESTSPSIQELKISEIYPNTAQPRTKFDKERLLELSESIKELGVIQPITVRKVDNKYQIIAGERRYRASKLAGLKTIPAYIRTADDNSMLEMALVENIQREDLDAIEVAITYHRLLEECNLTHDELSKKVGKTRSSITNYVRLLKLSPVVQLGIREKEISMGHARALVNVTDEETQKMIFNQIRKYDFSVRKVEDIVRELENDGKKHEPQSISKPKTNEEYKQLISHLSNFFKSDIDFKRSTKGKGKIIIPFSSDEDLERIVEILDGL